MDKIIIERFGGFFTGSRAFGVGKEESDYDYILEPDQYFSFLAYLVDNNIEYKKSEYFIGAFFEHEDKKYNVFLVHNTRFDVWVFATEIMKNICEKKLLPIIYLKEKQLRIRLFENLRNLYRNFE